MSQNTSFNEESDNNDDTGVADDDVVEDDNDFQDISVSELYMREYNIRYKKDTPELSEIHGMKIARLPGHVFVADYGNNCIKLLDRNFRMVTRHCSLFQPWDLAVLDDTFLVVTFPFVRLMQKFKIRNTTQIYPWFPVKSQNEYFAVCATRNHIIATCKYDGQNLTDTPSVHVMDHQGNVELIVDKDAEGRRLFSDPDYVTLDESLHVIYVSDTGNKTVVSLDMKGEILARFVTDIFEPRGITFDKTNGFVFVYDGCGESVLKLDQTLKPLEEIKCRGETLSNVLSLLYCPRTDQLMMATSKSHILKVVIV